MNIEHFKIGFEKTASAVKNLANAAIKSMKKAPSKAKSTNYSSYLQTKKTVPKPKTDVLDYNQLKSEMTRKNIASRDTIKRRLSDISNRPVLNSKSSRFSY